MTTATLDVFEKTIEKTHHWLNEIDEDLGLDDRHKAYIVLRATLHCLRDRLTINEAAQLSAQMPMLVRGIFFEGWKPTDKPERVRHRDEFFEQMQKHARSDLHVDMEQAARAVFKTLSRHITPGEIHDIKVILPDELRDLMPA
jgi:uncharacterized protein (DUF2267 family)